MGATTEAEGVDAGVEGGAPGAVVGANAAGAAPPSAALQEGVRDRRQAPAMVATAPAAGGSLAMDHGAGLPDAERTFERLEATRPRTVDEWRRLREDWRAFVASFPDGPRADEARVRTVEAGSEAWRTGGAEEDGAVFRRDLEAYLERPDALQKERVRKLRGR